MFPTNTRVLVLDDMPGVRQMIKGILRGMAFKHVTEAEDGEEGYALACEAAESKTPFGLVLCDWNMPKVNGMVLLQLMREHAAYEKVPFILVTAEGEFRQVKRAIEMRVTDYIVKPFTPDTLKTKLENAWKKTQAAVPAKG
jgi:two-component system chemotaxis response regulator CheY